MHAIASSSFARGILHIKIDSVAATDLDVIPKTVSLPNPNYHLSIESQHKFGEWIVEITYFDIEIDDRKKYHSYSSELENKEQQHDENNDASDEDED